MKKRDRVDYPSSSSLAVGAGIGQPKQRRIVRRSWSDAEDQLLRGAVKKLGASQWKEIAKMVPGRSHIQCLQRWNTSLHPDVIKGRWTSEEDARLLEIVSKNSHLKNWGVAAKLIPGRTAKQCRERYTHHLDPKVKKGDWSNDEDMFILESHKRLGNRWAEIATQLPGRTENTIKIRLSVLKKREKKLARASTSIMSQSSSDSSWNPSSGSHDSKNRQNITTNNNNNNNNNNNKSMVKMEQEQGNGSQPTWYPSSTQCILPTSTAGNKRNFGLFKGQGVTTPVQRRRLARYGSSEQKLSFGFASEQPFVDPNDEYVQSNERQHLHQHFQSSQSQYAYFDLLDQHQYGHQQQRQQQQQQHPYQSAFGTANTITDASKTGSVIHAQVPNLHIQATSVSKDNLEIEPALSPTVPILPGSLFSPMHSPLGTYNNCSNTGFHKVAVSKHKNGATVKNESSKRDNDNNRAFQIDNRHEEYSEMPRDEAEYDVQTEAEVNHDPQYHNCDSQHNAAYVQNNFRPSSLREGTTVQGSRSFTFAGY